MQNIDCLINARWIIPVEPKDTVYENHALIINKGRIIEIIEQDKADNKYTPATTHYLDDHILIPGLINSHTHAAMSLLRGLADDLPLMEWLNKHIWPAEEKWVNEEFVHDGTQHAIAEMLRSGITCFNDMYFFPEVTARIASDIGMRATVGMIILDFPSAWAATSEEYIEKGLTLHDNYRDHPLIKMAFAPHAPYTVSDGPLERIRVLADELDIPIHMHVHETQDEINQSLKSHNMRPIDRLDKLGLLSPRLLAVHMTHLDDREIVMLQDNGVHVVHCPESNMKLASGFCQVSKLQASGVNVALGTDGAASNNDLDMFSEMRTAALLAKAIANNAGSLPAHEALEMATINGARALGLENDIGSLAPGKAADIVAVHMDGIESTPMYHPVSQLVYSTGRSKVTDVWINGNHLLNDRVLTSVNEAEIIEKTVTWQEKIKQHDEKIS